jgi:DNA phosphorothioation-dependent restriction protein DptF
MTTNPLLEELKKLRESSKYAVAQGNAYHLDEFKKYLHIERHIEVVLKNIIIKASSNTISQLIIVAGNVGDGKSHILSHLHHELDNELEKFLIHNDATESHNPHESSNTTLYKLLGGFKDVNIHTSTDKIILAINLGTLSKFIEEYGDEFSLLRGYVNDNKILDTELLPDDESVLTSNFHHVNFTDYHMYSLTDKGVISDVISTLLKKIVSDDKANTIYQAYQEYKEHAHDAYYCPILYNYEFLFSQNNRNILIQLIIKAIIRSKEIVSVRTLLNFIYDIIVPVDLSNAKEHYFKKLEKMTGAEYLSYLIPNYLFEHKELSSLFEKIETIDPCSYRHAKTDEILLTLINAEETLDIFSEFIDESYLVTIKPKLLKTSTSKIQLAKFFIRLNYFSNYNAMDYLADTDFDEYVTWLFQYNNNNRKCIQKLYKLVEESARNWYGDPKTSEKVILNVGKKQTLFRVFKDFKVHPEVNFTLEKNDTKIERFTQEFTLQFKLDNGKKPVKIHVDYSLFKVLKMVSKGYRPNKKDNNNYVYFVSTINKLINQNNSTASLYIDEVNVKNAIDYKFSKDAFNGYKFQIV